jgi:hypothetical protein
MEVAMTQSTQFRKPSAPLDAPGETGEPQRRTITSIIQRELDDFGQRQPRRSRVVGRLIFLQTALLLMSAPLVAWPTFQPVALGIAVFGLALFGFAWLRNLAGDAYLAQRVLIAGSAFVTAAGMVGQILWHPAQVLPVGLASFPFLLTIFTAGLLFEPEVVLLVSVGTTAFSAVVFFLDLFLIKTPDITDPQIYLLAVTSLGLQALCGMMAWQVAHFIKDYSAELNQARREEFIATQYDALRRSVDEQAHRLREQVGMISTKLIALSTRDYTARIGIMEGELKPIADAFNLLAQQLGAIAEMEHASVNVVDDLTRLMDVAGQMAEGGAAGVPPLANMPMTPNAMGNLLRSVNVTLQRAQQSIQGRFERMRDLTVDSGNRLTQAAEQTYTAEAAIASTLATIGLLRAKADHVFGTAENLNRIIDKCLTELSTLLPPEVSAHSHIETPKPASAPEWQQVLPGVTIQLDAINDETQLGPEDLPPAAPAPAGTAGAPAHAPAGVDPTAQAKLREVWSLITQMTEAVAQQIRDAQVLEEQLGVSSRSMRQVDNEINALRQMILQIRQVAEQVYLIAAPNRASGPLMPPSGPASHPLNASDLLTPPDTSGGNISGGRGAGE